MATSGGQKHSDENDRGPKKTLKKTDQGPEAKTRMKTDGRGRGSEWPRDGGGGLLVRSRRRRRLPKNGPMRATGGSKWGRSTGQMLRSCSMEAAAAARFHAGAAAGVVSALASRARAPPTRPRRVAPSTSLLTKRISRSPLARSPREHARARAPFQATPLLRSSGQSRTRSRSRSRPRQRGSLP